MGSNLSERYAEKSKRSRKQGEAEYDVIKIFQLAGDDEKSNGRA